MPQSTARRLIRGSLRLLGAVASGENVEANEASDALDALNGMLSSWSLERLMIYHIPRVEVPTVVNQRVYTWGPGGDIPGDRPLRLERALLSQGTTQAGPVPPPDPEAPDETIAPPLVLEAVPGPAPLVAVGAWEAGWRQIGVTAEVIEAFGTLDGLERVAIGDVVQFDRWGYCELTVGSITTSEDFLTGDSPWTGVPTDLLVTPIGGAFTSQGAIRLTRVYFPELTPVIPPPPFTPWTSATPAGSSGPSVADLPGKVEWPVRVWSQQEYESRIWLKSQGSTYAWGVYLEPSYPLARLHAWPVPATNTTTLILFPWLRLTAFASLDALVDFPEGYERALRYGLAIELSPEYGREIPQAVALTFAGAIRNIKTVNVKVPLLGQPIQSVQGAGRLDESRYAIRTDGGGT